MQIYLIGLGVLGLTFGPFLQSLEPPYDFKVIADANRQEKLKKLGVRINGKAHSFPFVKPEELKEADLVIIASKSFSLESALHDIRLAIKPGTILLSLLNGISSEERMAELYPQARIVYAVAQGMDGVRNDYDLVYQSTGQICFGKVPGQGAEIEAAIAEVEKVFSTSKLPYTIVEDMRHHQWGKFMLNCGLNQTVAYFKGDYGTCQSLPEARAMMIDAFREVIAIGQAEGVKLGETDIQYWLEILDTLSPAGMPSMRQDQRDGRPMETELFSGTVIKLGEKHGIATEVNRQFYEAFTKD